MFFKNQSQNFLFEGFLLFSVMLSLSYFTSAADGPWWILVVPAFFYGAFREDPKISTRTGFLIVALAATGAWLLPAFYQDAWVGFRISLRISNVAHLPLRIFSYVITGFIGSLVATLGWIIGKNVREIVKPYLTEAPLRVNRRGD